MWWFLPSACTPWQDVAEPCTPLSETVITDPDGLAAGDLLDDLASAAARFDRWTGDATVCVDEIRLVDGVIAERSATVGQWLPDERRVELGVDRSVEPVDILFHELCHALDAETGVSVELETVLPEWPLNDDAYPTEAARRREYFAITCALGPPPRALLNAAEARCDEVPAVDLAFRDRVWAGWAPEEPAIGHIGALAFGETVLPEWSAVVVDGTRFYQVVDEDSTSGDGPGSAVFAVDGVGGQTQVWSGVAPELVPALEGAAPVVVDHGTETAAELYPGASRPVLLDWLVDLALAGSTDAVLGPDRAWYQTWGDGRPLQVYERVSGVTRDQPGDDDLALRPPFAWVDGAPWSVGYLDVPAPARVWRLGDTGVDPVDTPWGVDSLIALPDGRWLAAVQDHLFTGFGFWVVGEADGTWALSDSTCDPDAPFPALLSLGGAPYTADGEPITLPDPGR